MGHAKLQMTANIYGHLDMQRKELLTRKMASSLFKYSFSIPLRNRKYACFAG